MKTSRAYIAGLGTTGILIASFLLVLVIVSAIVAFDGAPGQASSSGLGRLDVREDGQGELAKAFSSAAIRAGARDRARARALGSLGAGSGGRAGKRRRGRAR